MRNGQCQLGRTAALTALRRHAGVPIHGHRNGFGMFNRAPLLGMDFRVYQKLCASPASTSFTSTASEASSGEPDNSVIASARACMTPFAGIKPIMPASRRANRPSRPRTPMRLSRARTSSISRAAESSAIPAARKPACAASSRLGRPPPRGRLSNATPRPGQRYATRSLCSRRR